MFRKFHEMFLGDHHCVEMIGPWNDDNNCWNDSRQRRSGSDQKEEKVESKSGSTFSTFSIHSETNNLV